MSRLSRGSASRGGASVAVLAVELSTRQPVNRGTKVRRVALAGGRQPPIGRRLGQPLSVKDHDAAARMVARGARPMDIAGLLAALAHPQRVEILLKLLAGEATHQSLAKATGLKAGPLYHHLRELRMTGLIGPKVRDLYVLTPKGGRAILAALAMERMCR